MVKILFTLIKYSVYLNTELVNELNATKLDLLTY